MNYRKPVRFAPRGLALPSRSAGARRLTGDVAFLLRMPAGIPGDVTRAFANAVIEPNVITPSGSTDAPTAYGVPVVIDGYAGTSIVNTAGQIRTMDTSDTTAISGICPYGILVRPFPTGASQDALGVSTPPASGACDVLRAGYCTVLLTGSTAAVKGGKVYVFHNASSGANVLGGITASSTNATEWLGATFQGPADTNGFVEIAFSL